MMHTYKLFRCIQCIQSTIQSTHTHKVGVYLFNRAINTENKKKSCSSSFPSIKVALVNSGRPQCRKLIGLTTNHYHRYGKINSILSLEKKGKYFVRIRARMQSHRTNIVLNFVAFSAYKKYTTEETQTKYGQMHHMKIKLNLIGDADNNSHLKQCATG